MKSLITSIFILSSLLAYSQDKSLLKSIQGTWEFKEMRVDGDTIIKTKNFHATDLEIKKDQFTIGLSEAYADGVIEIIDHKIKGTYKWGDHVFDEMSIYKVEKRRLIIRLTTSTPEYWTGAYNQNVHIYLEYKK